MYKPSPAQLDSLIDMIVEEIVRQLEEEYSNLQTAHAAPPTKEERGMQKDKTCTEYQNPN
jgi:hypothetical protein